MGGRIVVGVDGSAGSVAALLWALAEAELRQATVEAVSAWTFPNLDAGLAGAPVIIEPTDLVGDASQGLEATLVAAVPDEAARAAVVRRIIEHRPAQALIEAAEGADLLVVGSRGHNKVMDLLLGSVSTDVAHHSPVPVVIVRTPH